MGRPRFVRIRDCPLKQGPTQEMPRRLLLPLILLALAGRPEAQAQFPEIGSIADSSAVVVTGRVASVTVQLDAGSIYTYAMVAVDEVLKGQLSDSTVVVKQLGGTLPTLGLYIADQAAFRVDEDVLLFLAARPRDGTLYTVGLSRGKWDILPDLQTGGRSAVSGTLRIDLDDSLRSAVSDSRAQFDTFRVSPPELQSAAASFTFIPTSEGGPARWHQADDGFHIPVDYQNIPGGLPGGGDSQLNAAIGAWNAVGSRLQLDRGAGGGATCPSQGFTGSGRIGFYWNDPCGEVSDGDATTFGVGGGYFTPGLQKTINGVVFNEFLQGIAILNNVGPHLTAAACLQDAVTHVLGHAVGLGHSTDGAAVMYPTLRAGCASASSLASDDINGLRAILSLHRERRPSTAGADRNHERRVARYRDLVVDARHWRRTGAELHPRSRLQPRAREHHHHRPEQPEHVDGRRRCPGRRVLRACSRPKCPGNQWSVSRHGRLGGPVFGADGADQSRVFHR